jgi:protoporphyrin/coproporphyrin ferrochelatase
MSCWDGMYDAILLVSFGGPEKTEDVMPFLENVTRGRNVPAERLREVADHYYHFGGRSPLNEQCCAVIAALKKDLGEHGIPLPIYWGNRNWRPFLNDALRQMRADGIKHALALVTSAYSSYSSCRQYRENIAAAQAEVGEGAPRIDKLRAYYNHPGFIQACTDRVREALAHFSSEDAGALRLIATAHSIPCSMAHTSDYEKQLRETTRLVAQCVGMKHWDLVYQSRSGAPNQPWLGPDILDYLRRLAGDGVRNVIVAPLGFVSDHMEVLYDLDHEAQELAASLGMKMVRAGTAGTHPAFIRMLRQLICERLSENQAKLAVGFYGPNHDVCPGDCCPAPSRADKPRALEVPAALQRS